MHCSEPLGRSGVDRRDGRCDFDLVSMELRPLGVGEVVTTDAGGKNSKSTVTRRRKRPGQRLLAQTDFNICVNQWTPFGALAAMVDLEIWRKPRQGR